MAVCLIIVPLCGAAQLFLLFGLGNETQVNPQLLDRIDILEEVKVDLNLWNLFKSFKSSTILIILYLFYCVVVLEHEMQSLFDFTKNQIDFMVVPFIYVGVHAAMENTRTKVSNVHSFSILLTMLMILFSVINVMLFNTGMPSYISFSVFVLNLVLFQKLVFTNVAISLLSTFDIKNFRIANYVNGEFRSTH